MKRSALFLALLAGIAGCAHEAKPPASTMSVRGYAFAPPAFYRFCEKLPDLCSTEGEVSKVQLDSARLDELKLVNRRANARTTQRNEGGDSWKLPDRSGGDCEDLAILKKAELLKRGWPASTLLLTVGWHQREGHTLLTVRTDQGDLVLDNRTNDVKLWSKTPYRYFARQAQDGPGDTWSRIER